jgi:hypothetical protein
VEPVSLLSAVGQGLLHFLRCLYVLAMCLYRIPIIMSLFARLCINFLCPRTRIGGRTTIINTTLTTRVLFRSALPHAMRQLGCASWDALWLCLYVQLTSISHSTC